jgi:SEC-C motif
MSSEPVFSKAEGVTASEQYLRRLCEKSFLSLWTYPGVYRDQGKQTEHADGKEVCDLVVVFGNHVILFSDKDCKFPNSGNTSVDWKRWYRSTVLESAKQLWGAERWFRDFPEKLYLDRACREPFPITLPDRSKIRFHRIAVARGASERCRKYFGSGSGSLMLFAPWAEQGIVQKTGEHLLFTIGAIDAKRGFVHVLDEVTLDIVLGTLDTAVDFIQYLEKKEKFVSSPVFVSAAGEEELLAYYLQSWSTGGELGFSIPPVGRVGPYSMPNPVALLEGGWIELQNSQIWAAFRAWNEVSYFWDALIDRFARHTIAGSLYRVEDPSPKTQEVLLRLLAAEPRHRRRALSIGLIGQLQRAQENAILDRSSRVFFSSQPDEPTYIFLVVGTEDDEPHEEYRQRRRMLLQQYSVVAKHLHSASQHIISIGLEPKDVDVMERTEDILYLDASEWTSEMAAEAALIHEEFEILKDVKNLERPIDPRHYRDAKMLVAMGEQIASRRMGRNDKCPCGSGRKYKHCHGKS